MKDLLQYGKIDIKRSICSKRFVFCVAGIIMILIFSGNYAIFHEHDVLSMLSSMTGPVGIFVVVMGLLPLFPYAGVIAADYQQNVIRYNTIRGGLKPYFLSKYLIAVLVGMLTYGVAMGILTLVLCGFYPLYVNKSTGDGYAVLLEQGRPIAYFFMYILNDMLTTACLTATAVCVSVFIPSTYTVYSMPMVVCLFLIRFSEIHMESQYSISNFIQTIGNYGSPGMTFLMKLVPTLTYCAVLCVITIWRGKQLAQTE